MHSFTPQNKADRKTIVLETPTGGSAVMISDSRQTGVMFPSVKFDYLPQSLRPVQTASSEDARSGMSIMINTVLVVKLAIVRYW